MNLVYMYAQKLEHKETTSSNGQEEKSKPKNSTSASSV